MRTVTNILFAISAMLIMAAPAFAHAKLVASKPASGEILAKSPVRIELEFSVNVQPAMSSIIVTDRNGRQIETSSLETSEDKKTLWVALPELTAGNYKAAWRALSADDHMINGEFAFQVQVGMAEDSPVPERLSSEPDHSDMGHGEPQKVESVNWPQSLVRWFLYAAMMIISGGLVFRIFVIGRMPLDHPSLFEFDRSIRRLFFAATGVIITCLFASLALQSLAVFELVDLLKAFSILSETTFGAPWLLQFGAVIVTGILLFVANERRQSENTKIFWAALAVSSLMLVAPSLSGHARAASFEYGFAIPSDWLHLLAASVWVGGLTIIATVLPVVPWSVEQGARLRLLADVIHRFNTLAITATTILVLTGAYNSWIHIESFTALTNTLYGKVLLSKVGITLVMIGLGGINAYLLRPRILAAINGEARSEERTFVRNVKIEVSLAAAVLLLAAILAFLPPARGHMPVAVGSDRTADKQFTKRNG